MTHEQRQLIRRLHAVILDYENEHAESTPEIGCDCDLCKAALQTVIDTSELLKSSLSDYGGSSLSASAASSDDWPEEVYALKDRRYRGIHCWATSSEQIDHGFFETRRYIPAPPPQAVQGQTCETCGGSSEVTETYGECCGKAHETGDCCGDPVPVPVLARCPDCQPEKGCDGSGKLPHVMNNFGGSPFGSPGTCPGCSRCQPEKGGEG